MEIHPKSSMPYVRKCFTKDFYTAQTPYKDKSSSSENTSYEKANYCKEKPLVSERFISNQNL